MAAEEGNDYWTRRKKDGAPKKVETPIELWEAACDYFKECDDNPWKKTDFKGKDAKKVQIPTQTPYTWDGLERHVHEVCGLVRLDDYKTNKDGRYDDYADVIHVLRKIINSQQLVGSLVGAFNSNMVARMLGLVEKSDITTLGKKIQGSSVDVEINYPDGYEPLPEPES